MVNMCKNTLFFIVILYICKYVNCDICVRIQKDTAQCRTNKRGRICQLRHVCTDFKEEGCVCADECGIVVLLL